MAKKQAGTKKVAAKRKAAAKASRKGPAKAAKKAGRKAAAKTAKAGRGAKQAARKTAARKAAPKKAAARKAPARKAAAKKAAARKPPVRRAASPVKTPGRVAAPVLKRTAAKAAPATGKAAAPKRAARTAPVRGRIPSSLDLGGGPSAARSGREELLQHIKERTETSPAITAGDVDADWQLAYSSGDEAPGGDNPTPDQDVVDEIGEALGVQYDDDEELKGAAKIEERDKHRWELDPASKDDFDE